jgi:chemotaxis protein MotB
VDRANAARRLMQQRGLRPDQVTQVRGFADQNLRKRDDPMDPANRRISLIVQYRVKPEEDKSGDKGEGAPKSEESEGASPKTGESKETAAPAIPESAAKK